MTKIVGIDYGSKRIGVAVSDESGSVAFAKATLPNDKMLISNLVDLIKAEQAETVVVGESKDKDGNDNVVMKSARLFAEELERRGGVPVRFEPEFYSSVEARRDSGENLVDAKAAAIILNSFIERSRSTPSV